MDIRIARRLLEIDGEFTRETIQSAYIEAVKNARGKDDLETVLADLNVARDVLNAELDSSHELVSTVGRQLAEITARQTEIVAVQEARQQFGESVSALGRHQAARFRGARDVTGIVSALSGVLAFGKSNLLEIAPQLAASHQFSQMLLLMCAVLAAMAYGANRNAARTIENAQQLNHALTRERQIDRILSDVFRYRTTMTEEEFEHQLTACVSRFTGSDRRDSVITRALEMYSMLGFPIGRHIRVTRSMIDDYVDFLIKAGHIRISEGLDRRTVVQRAAKNRNL